MSDKPLNKYESALQEFVIFGYNKTKLASLIYGVSKIKGEGLGFHQKPYNPRIGILMKPLYPSSSSTAQKRLNTYVMLVAENGKVLNQSEPVMNDSQVLKELESKIQRSKVLSKLEPKTSKSEVLKNS